MPKNIFANLLYWCLLSSVFQALKNIFTVQIVKNVSYLCIQSGDFEHGPAPRKNSTGPSMGQSANAGHVEKQLMQKQPTPSWKSTILVAEAPGHIQHSLHIMYSDK